MKNKIAKSLLLLALMPSLANAQSSVKDLEIPVDALDSAFKQVDEAFSAAEIHGLRAQLSYYYILRAELHAMKKLESASGQVTTVLVGGSAILGGVGAAIWSTHGAVKSLVGPSGISISKPILSRMPGFVQAIIGAPVIAADISAKGIIKGLKATPYGLGIIIGLGTAGAGAVATTVVMTEDGHKYVSESLEREIARVEAALR